MRYLKALQAGFAPGCICLALATHAETRQLPPTEISLPVRPGAGLNMLPPPEVTRLNPANFVVQGDRMEMFGRFDPDLLIVEIGNPAVRVDIIGRSQTPAADGTRSVLLQFPPDFVAPAGAPLRAHHGTNGSTATITNSQRVLPRPTVVGFRLLSAPAIDLSDHGTGTPTAMEVTLANYIPGIAKPMLRSPDCDDSPPPTRSFRGPEQEIPGATHRIVFEEHFGPSQSGKRCTLELHPYNFLSGAIPGRYATSFGTVQLPSIASYAIENTQELLDYTTPSGRKLQATASKGALPCQIASVGTAGTFPTGVVREGGDLTFQLRNGLLAEQCEFKTTPTLEVRSGWRISKVEWTFGETSLCNAQEFGFQNGSPVSLFGDDSAVYPVLFQAQCSPNSNDLPKNSHRYLARLSRVVLMGPAGQNWKDAFK
jgi:hypothetical protein